MSRTFDCIVLGVGGFGSGALVHLARRGLNVLGLERFDIAHDRGSSHGETRIIRKAYFEHPDYVPLLETAYRQWFELQAASGRRLIELCGLVLAGTPDGEVFAGMRLASERHGVPIESIAHAEARRRFPGFRWPVELDVLLEPGAGLLHVEACVRAHVEQAQRLGAALRIGETVREWSADGNSVRVRTDVDEYHAAALVVTAGPWARDLLQGLSLPLEVVRKPVFWHETTSGDYDLARGAPAFYFETAAGAFYGFPSLAGRIVKVAEHTGGQPVADPLALDRDVHPTDTDPVSNFLRDTLPGVRPEPLRHSVCMYTHTPDRHFIVDRHPEFGNVALGAGFSGHGFKFTGVLGEALADLAIDGRTRHPIDFLALDRPALQVQPK